MASVPQPPSVEESPASWQRVWRLGIAPQLAAGVLEALGHALRQDDAFLIPGATTDPPPLQCLAGERPVGCCPLAYCGLAEGLHTLGDIEQRFAVLCWEAD
jgi:hypothetical protein